ncbi:alpha/beta hydrolase [Mucilaginibacter sp. cycad4]|uniref:alpha/beta hydrolase n=1 Tax=Mucilaginibacter sp. cycad4 TaxID=3342096 RepID=UPI002AAAA54D|nr:alpha/beta hydrolase [Mucilaginibacter gossypii]WPU97820.1 alpha/beta hydrolase [Mucilaginibacter gossypii]
MKKIYCLFPVLVTVIFICSCKSMRETQAINPRPDAEISKNAKDTLDRRKKVTNITILYGTDRRRILDNNGNIQEYDNIPAAPGLVRYDVGYTVVSIPPNHEAGKIETKSIWKLQFREDTLKHVVQRKITLLTDQDFNRMLGNSKSGEDAFIFVHGYNNSFKDAALRTAQLAFDIHLPITPIMFSWSSNAKPAAYANDEDRVQLAVPAFIDFLKRVAKNGHFNRLHLIAHSMGNRLISLAMLQIENDKTDLKIDQVIMAAPDIYASLFQLNLAQALTKKASHVTIYTAKNDLALMLSKSFHNDLRLGEIGKPPPMLEFRNIDIIDAVNQKLDFLGHDRFARSPVIIEDMDNIFKYRMNAQQRNIHMEMIGNYHYYSFP